MMVFFIFLFFSFIFFSLFKASYGAGGAGAGVFPFSFLLYCLFVSVHVVLIKHIFFFIY